MDELPFRPENNPLSGLVLGAATLTQCERELSVLCFNPFKSPPFSLTPCLPITLGFGSETMPFDYAAIGVVSLSLSARALAAPRRPYPK
jgi:hypothetical protein